VKCHVCQGAPATIELNPTVDGIVCGWDSFCLDCAEKYVTHWRKNGVTWERRTVKFPKRKKRATGTRGTAAELLVATYLESIGYLVHRAAPSTFFNQPGRKPFMKSHDLFGCLDMIGIQGNPASERTWAVQVTTKDGRAHRRKKIDALYAFWPPSWRVSLVYHDVTPHATHGARKNHQLIMEDYYSGKWWPSVAIPINPKALEAFRREKRAARG